MNQGITGDVASISTSLATITKTLAGLRRLGKNRVDVPSKQPVDTTDALSRLVDIVEKQDEAIRAVVDVLDDISRVLSTASIVSMRADRVAMAVKGVVEPITEKAEWAHLEVISQLGYGAPNPATR